MKHALSVRLEICESTKRLTCIMQNSGAKCLRIRRFDPDGDVFMLRRSDKLPVRYALQSSFGYELQKFTLSPGDKATEAVDILKLYEFREPGTYEISVRFDSQRRTSRLSDYSDCDRVVAYSNRVLVEIEGHEIRTEPATPAETIELLGGRPARPSRRWWEFWKWYAR